MMPIAEPLSVVQHISTDDPNDGSNDALCCATSKVSPISTSDQQQRLGSNGTYFGVEQGKPQSPCSLKLSQKLGRFGAAS